MTLEEKEEMISLVKNEFRLKYLRPYTGNEVTDKNGHMFLCKYEYRYDATCERHLIGNNSWNCNAFRLHSLESNVVNILCTNAPGESLIEVLDANLLSIEDFKHLYNQCKRRILSELYDKEKIYTNKLLEVTNDIEYFKQLIENDHIDKKSTESTVS